MGAPFWLSGGMPDVCPVISGYARVRVLSDDQTIRCEVVDATGAVVSTWDQSIPIGDGGGVNWLSCAADPATDDVFVFAQQTVGGVEVGYIVDSGGVATLSDGPFGLRSSKLQWEGSDLVLYMTQSLTEYVRWVDPTGSAAPANTPIGFNSGGQGMRYVSGTTPQWLVDPGGGFEAVTPQGVRLIVYVTRGVQTVGQATAYGDSVALALSGGAVVQQIVPVQSFDQYNLADFGDGSGLTAVCARTQPVGGNAAVFVVGPPWSGVVLASGVPSIPAGGPVAGGPTSNIIRKVRRPSLPASAPRKTYPHVAEITVHEAVIDDTTPVPRAVRNALAASQQSTRLLWDVYGTLAKGRTADLALLRQQGEEITRLTTLLQRTEATAREALTAAGKPTQRPVAAPTSPFPPPDPVGGPGTPVPPGGGAVVTPGTVDAFDARDVEWQGPVDPSGWTIGATITNVQITPSQVCLDYTGKNVWPAVDPSGAGVLSPGNPWVIAEIAGTKYGSTYEWLRVGQICKNVTGPEFQDYVLGSSPLSSWTPALGETVWFMVSSLARMGPQSPVNQRTQIVAVTWPF